MIFYILAFKSTHHAIFCENKLMGLGFDIDIIPTPKEITSSCGLSIKFDPEDIDHIQNMLCQHELSYYGIFKVDKSSNVKKVSRIGR